MKLKDLLVGGATALALSLPSAALAQTATPLVPSTATATVFTVRYVCLVVTPKVTPSPEEGRASLKDEPAILDEMQHGSTRAMTSTPSAYLHNLRAVQPDYSLQVLLAGSTRCVLDDPQAASIHDASDWSTYHTVLTENIFLSRNSLTNLTIHHTGQVAYSTSPTDRGGPGWLDMHTDKIVIGRVYTQGIDNQPDGRRITYAFCILPGDLDQMASAWNAHKTVGRRTAELVLSNSKGGK